MLVSEEYFYPENSLFTTYLSAGNPLKTGTYKEFDLLSEQVQEGGVMRFIPTRFHGYLDYILGAFLIASPWLLNFAEGGAETFIPVIVGASVILYSLITDYEVSATRRITMRTHLTLDFIGGLFLAASPWLFGFSGFVYLPHLVLGVGEMIASMCTHLVPDNCPENAPCYKSYAH